MITAEQLADLREGDVVELSNRNWHGAVVKGPVHNMDTGYLCVGEYAIARPDGEPFPGDRDLTLTVVSRAPRPLYVNSDRTEPVDGDIAKDRDGDAFRRSGSNWYMAGSTLARKGLCEFAPLTLLWDGTTGQVVPS